MIFLCFKILGQDATQVDKAFMHNSDMDMKTILVWLHSFLEVPISKRQGGIELFRAAE